MTLHYIAVPVFTQRSFFVCDFVRACVRACVCVCGGDGGGGGGIIYKLSFDVFMRDKNIALRRRPDLVRQFSSYADAKGKKKKKRRPIDSEASLLQAMVTVS